jgi:transcriptional regulator with XRE-family HTH domain
MGFGDDLRRAREAAGIGRAEAAGRAGMLRHHYARYEDGGVDPHWSRALHLIGALGLPLSAFVPASLLRGRRRRTPKGGGACGR